MDKPKSVEEYLAALPKDARATLEKIRQAIKAAAPTATEKIGYGMPGFSYDGRYLVYYAGFKTTAASSRRAPGSWRNSRRTSSPTT